MASTSPAAALRARPAHTSVRSRLYRGETRFDVIGKRRRWYALSALVILAGLIGLGVNGLNLSIDFKGGDAFQFAANGHTVAQAQSVLTKAGITDPTVTKIGENQITADTPVLSDTGTATTSKVDQVQDALAQEFGLPANQVSVSSVGSSWGSQITDKAIEGLVIFLVVVAFYIGLRFEPKMAVAAFVALIHDLLITIGIYALVGFQVSPSTVIAVLTILGFSLYDTVVVFDRVRENTADITPRSNRTYTTAANLAVNQTLMRSINTSLIALLPVAALLFVGAGLLGAGTLKDLALAQFVGLAAGAYSSIFIATPLLAQLKEREPGMRELQKRVAFLARTKPSALDAAETGASAAGRAEDSPPTGTPGAPRPAVTVTGIAPADDAGTGSALSAEPEAPVAGLPAATPDQDAPPRRPGAPLRQNDGRRRKNRGRPSGKRR